MRAVRLPGGQGLPDHTVADATSASHTCAHKSDESADKTPNSDSDNARPDTYANRGANNACTKLWDGGVVGVG